MSAFIPASFRRYFEPFLGRGALFFWLNSRGIKFESYLSDINDELINAYKIVVSRVEELIEVLKIYENTISTKSSILLLSIARQS